VKVAVIGTGYVGLVTGVGLAGAGHSVTCLDVRTTIVDSLRLGKPPIFETGLEALLQEMLAAGRLAFSVPQVEILADADIIMIAVGTPSKDGDIDLSQIRGASRLVAEALLVASSPTTVVVKSTVVPGTTSNLVRQTIREATGLDLEDYGLGMNPEFLREGSALADFRSPDRIVLGHENMQALSAMRELYASFDTVFIEVNTQTAELIKYANNMFLALQISAANEIAQVAASLDDVDPLAVMHGVISDHRWSGARASGAVPPPIEKYLVPGCGFGGSCFPKDIEALRALGLSRQVPMPMSSAILEVNQAQPRTSLTAMLSDAGDIRGRSVLVLGLAFKPGTDDIRQTPALEMVRALIEQGASVHAHDPLAADAFAAVAPDGVRFTDDWRAVAGAAELVLVVTPWPEYQELSDVVAAGTRVLDPRRAYAPAEFADDVLYRSIGVSLP
jgi:UDPglucose 6-dehydrogenase